MKKITKKTAAVRERLVEDEVDDLHDGDAADESGEDGSPRLVQLNKYLADHGVASRRKSAELVEKGKVTVDGETVTHPGTRIDPEKQSVEIDGFFLQARTLRKRYYLLNKPSGVVCTNEIRETRPRAVDLITDPKKGRIFTVGRLDEESKGLIILTNDGEFANRIMHPRYAVSKTYLVTVKGEIDDATLTKVREGVHLSEGRTSGARVVVQRRGRDHSLLMLTINEGMNREIRRVFARYGFKVTELRRVQIGDMDDRGLKPGRWRELLASEVKTLLEGPRAQKASEAEPRRKSTGAARTHTKSKGGWARHLVRGERVIARRPDAPENFREFAQRNAGAPPRAGGPKPRGAGARVAGASAKREAVGRTQRNGAKRPSNAANAAKVRGALSSAFAARNNAGKDRPGASSRRGPGQAPRPFGAAAKRPFNASAKRPFSAAGARGGKPFTRAEEARSHQRGVAHPLDRRPADDEDEPLEIDAARGAPRANARGPARDGARKPSAPRGPRGAAAKPAGRGRAPAAGAAKGRKNTGSGRGSAGGRRSSKERR